MNSDRVWHARWIKPGAMPQDTAPVFQKQFTLDSVPADATVYVSGMGFYVMQINGQRVGDELLTPAFSAYDRTVYYNVKPVAALLQPGTQLCQGKVAAGVSPAAQQQGVLRAVGRGIKQERAAKAADQTAQKFRLPPHRLLQLFQQPVKARRTGSPGRSAFLWLFFFGEEIGKAVPGQLLLQLLI